MKVKFRPFAVAVLVFIFVFSMLATGCSGGSSDSSDEESAQSTTNPLTGQTEEEGFDTSALNQRVAAFVVENSQEARPQWGMDDPQYSPDIVLQGEVEAGITRTLWMYADYNKLPEIIGPMRSARPPYIRFSELFDAIFIHWGQSASKGDYVGAKTVFKKDKVDHIDQMTFDDTVGLYDRDHTRAVAVEHTGILHGDKVADAIAAEGFRTEPKEYTHLSFDSFPWMTSIKPAETVRVTYSDVAAFDRTYWTYDPDDGKYHTANFNNDFERDNLLILYDNTEYIDKDNYQGQLGYTITYCDYALGGGKGYLISQGTYKDIEWRVEDGKLILVDTQLTRLAQERAAEDQDAEASESDEEEAPKEIIASLNPGKTWIGWISANNGGNVEIGSEE